MKLHLYCRQIARGSLHTVLLRMVCVRPAVKSHSLTELQKPGHKHEVSGSGDALKHVLTIPSRQLAPRPEAQCQHLPKVEDPSF